MVPAESAFTARAGLPHARAIAIAPAMARARTTDGSGPTSNVNPPVTIATPSALTLRGTGVLRKSHNATTVTIAKCAPETAVR